MTTDKEHSKSPENPPQKKEAESLSLMQTIKSVLWAMLGIQSKENHKRDFAHGSAKHFIIIGLLLVILFVISLVLLVKLVLYLAT